MTRRDVTNAVLPAAVLVLALTIAAVARGDTLTGHVDGSLVVLIVSMVVFRLGSSRVPRAPALGEYAVGAVALAVLIALGINCADFALWTAVAAIVLVPLEIAATPA